MPHIDPQFAAEKAAFARAGIIYPDAIGYLDEAHKFDYQLAMDAQPSIVTASNSGVIAYLASYIDPKVINVLSAANTATNVLGEAQKGSWPMDIAIFTTVENTGEVTSYGDDAEGGRAGINIAFPQREQYRFQLIIKYGQLELAKAELAKINYASAVQLSAAAIMAKFLNYTYFFGVAGLQNYGMLNDPNLSPAIAPLVKALGGVKWRVGSAINLSANEGYADFQALFAQLLITTAGNVDAKTPMKFGMSPASSAAMYAKNSFGLSAWKMIKDDFPNVEIVTAVQYGAITPTNPQGSAAGEVVQLIAEQMQSQDVGANCFSEKMRMGTVIQKHSAIEQKVTGGTWGSVIFQAGAVATMIGV